MNKITMALISTWNITRTFIIEISFLRLDWRTDFK